MSHQLELRGLPQRPPAHECGADWKAYGGKKREALRKVVRARLSLVSNPHMDSKSERNIAHRPSSFACSQGCLSVFLLSVDGYAKERNPKKIIPLLVASLEDFQRRESEMGIKISESG